MRSLQNQSPVKCSWCGSLNTLDQTFKCKNCGGPLSAAEGEDPGLPPPPAPRILPKKYIKNIKYWKNAQSMIGVIFIFAFFWTLIFPLIGYFVWRSGKRKARNELLPLQQGTPAKGEIIDIYRNTSVSINGRNPWTVEFVFDVKGQKIVGSVENVWERIDVLKQPGDAVWVVYMPENPHELSSIWPPLR